MKKSPTTKKVVRKSDSHTDEIKRYIKELNKGTERYIGAIAEDFGARVSAIAEQFLGLNDKFDGLNDKFEGMNEKLDAHSERFVKIENKLDVHTQMIGQLMVDAQEIKTDLKQKVDRSEFSRLEKRVIVLETGRSLAEAMK